MSYRFAARALTVVVFKATVVSLDWIVGVLLDVVPRGWNQLVKHPWVDRFSDRERFRREPAARWDDRRLAAYTEYSHSLKPTASFTHRFAAHLGNDSQTQRLTPDEAFVRLGDAYDARGIAWEALLLLGSQNVVDAAREWFHSVQALEQFVRDQINDPAKWSTMVHDQRLARAKFYEATRRDLAVPPGTGLSAERLWLTFGGDGTSSGSVNLMV